MAKKAVINEQKIADRIIQDLNVEKVYRANGRWYTRYENATRTGSGKVKTFEKSQNDDITSR